MLSEVGVSLEKCGASRQYSHTQRGMTFVENVAGTGPLALAATANTRIEFPSSLTCSRAYWTQSLPTPRAPYYARVSLQ